MIKIPYVVTADISKYEGEVFNTIPDSYYLSQKKIELEKLGPDLTFTMPEGYPLVEHLSQYCGLKKTNEIIEVALRLEEDVAILQDGRLTSICFCFPSGFRPADKMGMTFMEMHAPVADRQKLDRASDKVVEMISKPGARFRRYVWTLTTSPELSRHPDYRPYEPVVSSIDKLFFRKETQTTVGHDDGRTTFFFVKVEVIPFLKLNPEMQLQAINSMNSMSDSVLEYKGLKQIKKLFS